ncbi:carbamoyl transferase [bacterium]|nr:carbamoyl transferase [bacterium]
MKILGVGGLMHDYNCALVDLDAKSVAMCEAERLSRRKHHILREDPREILAPVRYCCERLGCSMNDIDVIAFAHTDFFQSKDWFKPFFPAAKFVDVDHHLSHCAAGFYASEFADALILSMDAFGDGTSTLLAEGRGNRINQISRSRDIDSIGLEYLRCTHHLGLGTYGAEGKTQGLAPYGKPRFLEAYRNEIRISNDGVVEISPRLRGESNEFAMAGNYAEAVFLNNDFLNGLCPRRVPGEELLQIHKDVAASAQKMLEEAALELCRAGLRRTRSRRLVLTGGVALNSSMNGFLARQNLFAEIFALPMASDRGTALGAALYYAHDVLGEPRFFRLDHVYYGNEYSDAQIESAIRQSNLSARKCDDIFSETARLIDLGGVIGWFQGASEVGARALGHRSIVADPRRASMKSRVNDRVKHREWFRPFAPSVLESHADDYFTTFPGVDLSAMTVTVRALPEPAQRVPAVVHVDETARIQVVRASQNGRWNPLLQSFHALTGIPMLLNTSFNDNDEPIVESPVDAIRTFVNTDMDTVVLGDYLLEKK